MWYLFCCLVNIWSKLFFVLKYVAWCFYMWYTELVCLFEYWVCILCLLYFTELVVDIVVFAVLVISVHLGILCTATWKCRGGILKMYMGIFSLNLFVTHDIFIVYFFAIRILFCVVDRISVSLLFNWVLYFYYCPLCFVFELCVWYWKVQTWYLLLCWLRLYTNLCNWVTKGVLILFVPLSRRVILFCDIFVTKFPFPLFRRRICRSKVILGILKNGVLGVLSKFCILQKLDYFVLSQVCILSLVIFQWVLALTFIYFVIKFGVCYLVLLYILIFIFDLTFYLLFWYFIICVDFCLYYDICYFHFYLLFSLWLVIFTLTCYFHFDFLFLLWLAIMFCIVIFASTCYCFIWIYYCVSCCYFCFDLLLFLFEFCLFFELVLLPYWNMLLCFVLLFLFWLVIVFIWVYLSFEPVLLFFVWSVPLGFLPWILTDFMLLFWKICLRAVHYSVL